MGLDFVCKGTTFERGVDKLLAQIYFFNFRSHRMFNSAAQRGKPNHRNHGKFLNFKSHRNERNKGNATRGLISVISVISVGQLITCLWEIKKLLGLFMKIFFGGLT